MAFASGGFGSAFGGNKTGGSLFGSTQPAQSTGGLFGQSTQQQQPATNVFGQPQQQQQQQQQQQPAGGLFGQTNQQTGTGTGTGTSLFGQTNSTQQPSGGLFGQATQNQTQPTGGLFGQSTTTQQPTGGLFGQSTQQNQPAGGGLFGQSTQQNQQPAAGGLFGTNNQQQQQQAGLFGQSTTQPSGGLFGQTNAQQPATGGGLFGSTNQQQQGGLFGSTLGQQPAQQQSGGLFGNTTQQPSMFGGAQPQQQSNLGLSTLGQSAPSTLLTKGTKFNDLPDEIKRAFEGIDAHIQGRVQISKELHQRKLGEESSRGQDRIRNLHKDYVDASTLTHNDLVFMRDLKAKAEQAVEDTIVATRIVEGFRNPQAGGAGGGYLKDHAGFPLEFFSRVTENMKHRLAWYKSTIEQIERKLSSTGHNQTPQGIAATLQAQHATFIALANKTALVDAELQKIKAIYTQLWRQKTGSMRDPFNPLDSGDNNDFGMSSLEVK